MKSQSCRWSLAIASRVPFTRLIAFINVEDIYRQIDVRYAISRTIIHCLDVLD
ncbi:MAG: hypothetical protein AAF974_03855 [Cyanobacteria bacterium P01_E01_bin.34]